MALEKFANTSVNLSISTLFIYPNPSNEQITIKGLSDLKVQQICIYSLSGKKLYTCTEKEINSEKLNIQSLNSCIYFLKIHSAAGEDILKFVKQ
ncbi:T9SS type A sorting domain-containing protein [Crocinitomix catalasitica]|uniref:T9SS type A sorting domain-containing protein n=1 Tax=Crocinitomix catalasitica TaxID=184607 RepID=UPI00048367E2